MLFVFQEMEGYGGRMGETESTRGTCLGCTHGYTIKMNFAILSVCFFVVKKRL